MENTDRFCTTFEDIQQAHKRIKPYIHCTPILTSKTLDLLSSSCLFFKCENLQKIGAFKIRGATNATLLLSEAERTKGVVTHSSGNHAQALALAAREFKIPAYIVMPSNSPVVKKNAVKGYGAIVTECEPTLEARELTAKKIIKKTGATFIHPYDNRHIIAGQGTTALELIEQAQRMGNELDAIIVPVGGGGLLAGCSIAAKGLKPSIRVFAAEPAGADDCKRSFAAGKLLPQTSPNTVADGLRTSVGEQNWQIIHKLVEDVLTVTDEQIVQAMKLVWERMKIVVEPSGAVPVAVALFSEEWKKKGIKNVGLVISGGNVDLNSLPWSSKL